MKRQIAEFLGELAEEMGWEPELEDQRVRLEPQTTTPVGILNVRSKTNPEPPARTRVASSPPDLNTEVRHLRSSLNHLSSEVTHLRAEMARLKKLPAPPDSGRDDAPAAELKWTPTVAESKRVTSTPAGMGDVRPWPAHLVPQPDPEPASPTREAAVEKPVQGDPVAFEPSPEPVAVEPASEPVAVEPPREPVALEPPQEPVKAETAQDPLPVEALREPVSIDPLREPLPVETQREPVPVEPMREPLPVETQREPVPVEPLREPESQVRTEIDEDSPLELFPSEPTSAKDAGSVTTVP